MCVSHVMVTCADLLLVAPVESNTTALPSPSQLMRKIIIKHKKLTLTEGGEPTLDMPPPVAASSSEPVEVTDLSSMLDLSNSIKNGYLFMQDPIDKVRVVMGVVSGWRISL